MGLSSLPSPAEGVLAVVLVNTAISVAILKGLLRSILQAVGIRCPYGQGSDPTGEWEAPPSDSFGLSPFAEEFCCRFPAVRFASFFLRCPTEQDCAVCLSQFEPESETNRLPCGHLFHKACLDKWLRYWNVTCPLCRAHVLPNGEEDAAASPAAWPWF